jgi:hypothetical protein
MKLLGVGNMQLDLLVLALVMLAVPLWGAIDATSAPGASLGRRPGESAHGGRGAAGRCSLGIGLLAGLAYSASCGHG